jgi:hypothetical protein
MSVPDGWYGRGTVDPAPRGIGLARHTRAWLLTGEVLLAAAVAGVALRSALGWTVLGVAVAIALAAVAAARTGWPGEPRTVESDSERLLADLRVVAATSRSTGEVGVLADGQGFVAGLEVDLARGAVLDLGALCGMVGTDASRPSAVQLRLTTYAPPAPPSGAFRNARDLSTAVNRRLHLLLRLEPARAGDVVARHGGGAQGSRAALVAAVDRLAARLRRAGVGNRVLDAAALNGLVAEDTAGDLPRRLFTADLGEQRDLDRIVGVLDRAAPERCVLSVCVEFAGGDQWLTSGTLLIGSRNLDQAAAVAAALRGEGAVLAAAGPEALARVLPLGGGPGDLTSVLTLARV